MTTYRIYIDESGTHENKWLIIGMLFVPAHGPLQSDLCGAKESRSYFNMSQKHSHRYKETHLTHFKSQRDVDVGKDWIASFLKNTCFYRSVVVDWSIWEGKHFGGPFESDALKKRRAYKKWAEMLLQPELAEGNIRGAALYLDRLRMVQGYDVIPELEERFMRNYQGGMPYISKFEHTESYLDAHQCLQLCDLLTGCLFQTLAPSKSPEKLAMRDYLTVSLATLGVKNMTPSFWKGYSGKSLRKHHPKYSAWFWRPTE